MALKRARNRKLRADGSIVLLEFQQKLGWTKNQELTVVPIGRGVYVAPLPKTVRWRADGDAILDDQLLYAMSAMIDS